MGGCLFFNFVIAAPVVIPFTSGFHHGAITIDFEAKNRSSSFSWLWSRHFFLFRDDFEADFVSRAGAMLEGFSRTSSSPTLASFMIVIHAAAWWQ